MSVTTPELRQHVVDLVQEIFERGLRDWGEMFGFKSEVHGSGIRSLKCSTDLIARIMADGALVQTSIEGRYTGPILFVFPSAFLGAAIGGAMMLPPVDDPSIDPQDEQHVEAAQELMNLFCGSATQVLQDYRRIDLRVSQSVDDLAVYLAMVESTGLVDGENIYCVHVEVAVGDRKERAWCLLTAQGATAFCAAHAGRSRET